MRCSYLNRLFMRFYIVFLLLFIVLQNLNAQPAGADVGVSGMVKPKRQSVKPAKVKFDFHEGKALLKSGLIIEGKFKYIQPKSAEVPIFVFIEQGSKVQKTVALSMIDKLTLAGAEKGITARLDSTEFVWIDKYRDLYRKVRTGAVELYDNSRVVDETYEYLTDYVFIASRQDYGYKLVRKLADVEMFMSDRPYFMESAKITNRYETQDFRVIVYLVDLFNDPNPMRSLKWDEMTITLKSRQTLQGYGYIQPLDMRNEYIESTSAYVHFYDGKDFKLLSSANIKDVIVGGVTYVGGVYGLGNKLFYGKKWDYQGTEYAIVQRLTTGNNYFFRSRSVAEGLVILKKTGETYLKPVDEAELRKAYLDMLRTGAVQ